MKKSACISLLAFLFIAPIFIGAEGISVVGELDLDKVGQGKGFRMVKTRRFGSDVMIEGLFENNLQG